MNRHRVFVWALILAGFILVGWLAWAILAFFFGPKDPEKPSTSWVPSTFFPIVSPGIPPTNVPDEPGDDPNRRNVPRLRQLSDAPTAGMVAFEYREGSAGFLRASQTVFRWIDRATGHIYEARAEDATKTRVSNTTIPGVQEGFFSDDGKSVVARYLRADNETVETLVGQIETVTEQTSNGYVYSETKLVTRFLSPGIVEVGDAPRDGTFYTLEKSLGGGSTLSIGSYATGTPRSVFSSPLSQILVFWASSTLAIQTKANPDTPGFLFLANTSTGEAEKIIEDRRGLTVSINPAGTRALFSETINNDLRLWTKNLKTGDERLLELRTLPEKCAWHPTNEEIVYCGAPDFYVRGPYPTNWYQGRFSFDDNIWSINVESEDYKIFYDTRTEEETFDIWKPQTSPDGNNLLFLNKRDLTLWVLDLQAEVPQAGESDGNAN